MANAILKNDVIMAGIGGMGVLMAGKLLAWAALEKHKYVSWLPSYGVEKRGGVCECTVIFSNSEISSPLLDQAKTLIVFAGSQLGTFESRVNGNGIMLIDSADIKEEAKRSDYKLIKIPAVKTAHEKGDSKISNLIMLGAYIGATQVLSHELVQETVKKNLGKDDVTKNRNKEAIQLGIKLGSAAMQ
ncbi:MAG TPA: 2-oxoacid:ferredoxin oxidoreductase subunit gamma [Desulfobacteraceae bacterium]|nr:2-oxoacid:ferredoxin oxidoreductase subunit gamma [Desulfobacteraceae bacterium]